MKPNHLKLPFVWKERKIMIHDRVWYLPAHYDFYDTFTFPGWHHPDVFADSKPIKVEYCSGNGAWIAAKAANDKTSNWVAIEKKFERARKIWSKLKNENLDNLLIICGEGYKATYHYFPTESVSELYINFPDPWPKNRHAKHRLIQPFFIKEIERILQPGGTFTLVTDDENYSNILISLMKQFNGLESCYQDPFYISENPHYGTSYFEDLWRSKGKQIRYHQFQKKS